MLSLGIDIGTTGMRAAVLDKQHKIVAQSHIVSDSQSPALWWDTLKKLIFVLKKELQAVSQFELYNITHLAIDGTSGTVLLADKEGQPCSRALMYNDQRAVKYAQIIDNYAPENTAARGATSGLAKLLWLYHKHQKHYNQQSDLVHYALNQADWITGKLSNSFGFSDYNNALKIGYDAELKCWPEWLIAFLKIQQFPIELLPEVYSPGEVIAKVDFEVAQYFGFSSELQICAGTTDSTAAIIASGAKDCGEGITSLGSTLVMKVITDKAIFNAQAGVYSQPYGNFWLVGGASNSGGAILKHFFSSKQLSQLTDSLNQKIARNEFKPLDFNYYPLLSPGERFPIQDHQLKPNLLPKAKNNVDFFQALLEGMADIETLAYQRLLELGTPYPKHVKSIGGGALNHAWQTIRQNKLGVPVQIAELQQAAAGSAILAQSTW